MFAVSRLLGIVLVLASLALAQRAPKYSGPRPEKPDAIYLLHADNLVEVDAATANEEQRKDEMAYVVNGASAQARTPLAEPMFLLESKTIPAEKLELYRLDVKNGRREIVFSQKRRKDGPRALHLSVSRLDGSLYRIEVNVGLENGEYVLTPSGSNQVFCFQVY